MDLPPIENVVTPSGLWITIVTLIGLAAVALLVLNLIGKIRELRKPKMTSEKSIEEKLKSDAERLSLLEAASKKQGDEMKLLLRSQLTMIRHMIDGNNIEKLKEAQDQINDYLVFGKLPQ